MALVTIATLPSKSRQSTAEAPDVFETPQPLTAATIPVDSYVLIRTQIAQVDLVDPTKFVRLRLFTSPDGVAWTYRRGVGYQCGPDTVDGVTGVSMPPTVGLPSSEVIGFLVRATLEVPVRMNVGATITAETL